MLTYGMHMEVIMYKRNGAGANKENDLCRCRALATALTFGACLMFPDNQCTLQASVLAVYLVA